MISEEFLVKFPTKLRKVMDLMPDVVVLCLGITIFLFIVIYGNINYIIDWKYAKYGKNVI